VRRQFEPGLVVHRKRSPAKFSCLAGLLRLEFPHMFVPHYSRVIREGGGPTLKAW
jgi:hypothetical protein